MFNFERLFAKAEDYISSLGIYGGLGGALGLYVGRITTDYTTLGIIAASTIVPSMLLKKESGISEMQLDVIILAGPLVSMWWFQVLTIEAAFYFSLGAMLASAAGTALMNNTGVY